MGRIVIACYRPKPGQDEALAELMPGHVPALRAEGLVTDRESLVMRARDGTILEVFEWQSEQAIEAAHANPVVARMWERYEQVCDYVTVGTLAEAHQVFATFEPLAC